MTPLYPHAKALCLWGHPTHHPQATQFASFFEFTLTEENSEMSSIQLQRAGGWEEETREVHQLTTATEANED